jgi:hypothetical protein
LHRPVALGAGQEFDVETVGLDRVHHAQCFLQLE